MLYSAFDCRVPILTCRSGETGRRAGLKIPWGSPPVWVRFPPPAPAFAPLRLATLLGELRLGKPVHTRRLSRRSCGRRAAIRTTAKADRSRSPPACHSPRGATAGQASPHAKAVPPKLWEESRHPDHSEGGPLSLPSGLPLSSGSYGWASQSTREGCLAEAVGGEPPSGPQRRRTALAPLQLAAFFGELGLSSQSPLERRAVPAQSSDTFTVVRSARGLWRSGRRNAQCDEAGNTRHPVKVPVVSTHDRSLVM